ncbi:hypothetical protein [Ureaplasma diversum]|uniref:hypothetical protein n=1 Tax=Ureaplasma diversum TaxID=42094 RepID=UPI00068FEADE|nr:hypothetical protein [Ureaplasma diversum]
MATISRGTSPLPISDYITSSEDGIHWIKIGDAPSLGHFIEKTSEKIKPSGIGMSLEVYPNDLILSTQWVLVNLIYLRFMDVFTTGDYSFVVKIIELIHFFFVI